MLMYIRGFYVIMASYRVTTNILYKVSCCDGYLLGTYYVITNLIFYRFDILINYFDAIGWN